jgi:hypothetical protein
MKRVTLIWILFLLWSVPVHADALHNYLEVSDIYQWALYYELSWSNKSIVAVFTNEQVPCDIVALLSSKEMQGVPVGIILLRNSAISSGDIQKLQQAHIRIMWDDTDMAMSVFQHNVYAIDGSIIYNGQIPGFRFVNPKLAGQLTRLVIK